MKYSIPKEFNKLLAGEVALDVYSEKIYVGTTVGMKEIDPIILDDSVLAEIEAFKRLKGCLSSSCTLDGGTF